MATVYVHTLLKSAAESQAWFSDVGLRIDPFLIPAVPHSTQTGTRGGSLHWGPRKPVEEGHPILGLH